MDDLWLQSQFKKNPHLGKTDLAVVLSLNASAISKMLSGTRQIKAREYLLMRKFFGLPTGDMPPPLRIEKMIDGGFFATEPKVGDFESKHGPPKYDLVTVPDAGMLPDFLPGEKLLLDRHDRLVASIGIYAFREKNSIRIRILDPHGEKMHVSALSQGREYKDRLILARNIHVIGRVVGKISWL
jgi:hypothetical protein